MPKLSPEDRERLKSTNPGAVLMRTPKAPGEDFVFRAVTLSEFDAFLMAVNSGDTAEKVYAHRNLAADLVIYPPREQFQQFAKDRPGVAHVLGDELAKQAGMAAEVQVDAL